MQTLALLGPGGTCESLVRVEGGTPWPTSATVIDVGELGESVIGRSYVEGQWVPPLPPAEVTMRQARLALFGAGKLAAVDAAIDAMTEPAKTATRIWWEYSNALERGNPLVVQLGAALGLTPEQIDALFVTAHTL